MRHVECGEQISERVGHGSIHEDDVGVPGRLHLQAHALRHDPEGAFVDMLLQDWETQVTRRPGEVRHASDL